VDITAADDGQRVRLSGDVLIGELERLRGQLSKLQDGGAVVFDLADVEAFDTAGAWMILHLVRRIEAEGAEARIEGASEVQSDLLEAVRKAQELASGEAPEKPGGLIAWLEDLGRKVVGGLAETVSLLEFLGIVVARIAALAIRPWRLRLVSLVHHMHHVGLDAIPIVSLMAFLVGVVLAFQGAAQLRQFGAEVFVVDLIAISILRELGILLTAIIVAGRSGSAFTAAIGSMKMREEIDAMRILGLDPAEILVVPRVLALIIVLPILGVVADLMGLLGGMLMSWIELGVSPGMFRTRLAEVDVWHYAVGLIKAPFFAAIIGVIGCHQGMQVGGDAESLGRLTSKSVVLAIFWVIVADAVFSIFFQMVGV